MVNVTNPGGVGPNTGTPLTQAPGLSATWTDNTGTALNSPTGPPVSVTKTVNLSYSASGDAAALLDQNGNIIPTTQLATGQGKNVILDSQWIADTDEYRGLRILAWAHSKQIINLLAVTNSFNTTGVTNPDAPQIVSQILTTQGVNGVLLSSGPTTTQVTIASTTVGAFLTQAFSPLRRLRSSLGLNTSVPVLRQALASASTPVDICCQGTGNNLYDLLNSLGDSISPLSGAQLIQQKVGTLYWVGGQYPLSTAPVGAEFNFGNVPGFTTTLWPITAFLLANWPTPITFIGFEMGPPFSCGAYDFLTPTDPIGFLAGVNATGQFGRQGWGTVASLVALQGPAKAGFTTVKGTNTINVTTGFNTFIPNNNGPHSYVVPVVSQRAIQQINDAICAPGSTQPSGYVTVAEQVYTTPATSAQIDGVNLISWYYAPDIALANAAPVPLWPDRCGRANLVQATVGLQPTYATALISEIAVSFAGTAALVTDANVDLPHNCTIYAYVECNALSAAFMFAVTHGISVASNDQRGINLGRSRTSDTPPSAAYGQSVVQTTFSTGSAGTVVLNTWCVIAIVRNGGNVQGFLNGVGGTLTAISVPANFDALTTAVSNHIVGPLVAGAAFVDGGPTAQSGWNGGIKEIRVYNNAHTQAQVSAVTTAMTT